MSHIDELRAAVKAIGLNGITREEVIEIFDRLEAAEKERDVAELMSLALRAKVEAMEQQEPAGTLHDDGCFVWRGAAPHQSNYAGWKMTLYALPGAQSGQSIPEAVMEVIAGLVYEVERNICSHEETHRGGTIWEICDMCGAKWADDEGGKPEFKWPKVVEKARAMLEADPGVKGE